MIAGSLKRLYRNGRPALGESGPPKFIKPTARRAISVDVERLGQQTRQSRDVLGRRLRQYPMPEIEDIRSAAERRPQLPRGPLQRVAARDQQYRIEIALHREERLQPLAGKALRHRGVEADRIDTAFGRVPLVEQSRSTRKPNNRHRRKALAKRRNNASGGFDDPALKTLLGQHPGPAVE